MKKRKFERICIMCCQFASFLKPERKLILDSNNACRKAFVKGIRFDFMTLNVSKSKKLPTLLTNRSFLVTN